MTIASFDVGWLARRSKISMVRCDDCGRFTTPHEASLRRFNTGLCADCGGGLSIFGAQFHVEPQPETGK